MASSVDLNIIAPGQKIIVSPYHLFSGARNMAIDHSLAVRAAQLEAPVLRFYGWRPHCLSLGHHQKTDAVNFAKLKEANIDLVRRPTGGSAILHAHELTYGLIVPHGNTRHHQIYQTFHYFLGQVLQKLGYEVELHEHHLQENYLKEAARSFACFNRPAFTEIKWHSRKLVGSAQKLFPDSLLQHGSLLISGKQSRALEYLNYSEERRQALAAQLDKSSVSLEEIRPKRISAEQLSQHILKELANYGLRLIYSPYSLENDMYDEHDYMELFNLSM